MRRTLSSIRSLEEGVRRAAAWVFFQEERAALLRMCFTPADVVTPELVRGHFGLVRVPSNLPADAWNYPAVRGLVMLRYGQMLLGQSDPCLAPVPIHPMIEPSSDFAMLNEFFVDYASAYRLYLAAPILFEDYCDDIALFLEESGSDFAPSSRYRVLVTQSRHIRAHLNPETAHLYGGYGGLRHLLRLAREFSLSSRPSKKLLDWYVNRLVAEGTGER